MLCVLSDFWISLKKRKKVVAILIFCFSLVWMLFLVQGLPIGDLDDWALIFISGQVPWQELGTNFVTPWSKSDFWFNQSDLFDQIRHKRIFNGLVLKFTQDVLGFRFFNFYLTTKVFFVAGIMTLVYLLISAITVSSLGITLAAFAFFFLIPAHYAHFLWIADPITIALFFVTLGMCCFYKFVSGLERGQLLTKLWPWIVGILLAGWFGIKTKEPALIFPVTAGAYLMLHWRQWKSRWPLAALVLCLFAVIMLQLVPIEKPPAQGFHYSLTNIKRMLLLNYSQGYDDETRPAFFSLEALWPVSMARTFGFFSLWGLVLFAFLQAGGRLFHRASTPAFFDHPLARLSALWVVIELLLMGLFQPEPRYFSGTMIPVTLLAARLVWCVLQSWRGAWRKALMFFALFCWGWTVLGLNFQHVVSLRIFLGQRSNRLYETARAVYSDFFKKEPGSIVDVATFYCAPNVLKKVSRPRMDDVVYYADDLYYKRWDKTEDGSLDDFKRFAEEGALYYITSYPEKFDDFQEAKLAAKLPSISRGSLFEFLRYSMKKKKPAPVYIYKYSGLLEA